MTNHIKESESNIKSLFQFLCTLLTFALILLFLNPVYPGVSLANAQGNDDEVKADFLFQKPDKFFGFRVGIFSPTADSGLFDMITEQLTVEKSDFRAWDFGIEAGFSMRERFELVFSLDYSKETVNSEFRDYVDEDGLPIAQSTKFSQTPLTCAVKFLLIPRGRQVGQYSWVPSMIVPFLSGGAGILWYEFRQDGDFVDFSTLEIFSATLKSSGGSPTVFLGAGADVNIFKSTYINLDFRYYWADDDLDSDFVGFDPIDLGGYRLTTGVQWHF